MNNKSRAFPFKIERSSINLFQWCLLLSGLITNYISYNSMMPIIVTVGLLCLMQLILKVIKVIDSKESQFINQIFLVGFLAGGISAFYRKILKDDNQLTSDPNFFFQEAIRNDYFENAQLFLEHAIPLITWGFGYELLTSFEFEKDQYVGISINISLVTLSSVFAIKTLYLIVGKEQYHLQRLKILISSSLMIYLFSSVHLRDAFILLNISIIMHAWTNYLKENTCLYKGVQAVVTSIVSAFVFDYLRDEFILMPLIFSIMAITTLIVIKFYHNHKNKTSFFKLFIIFVAVMILVKFSYEIMNEYYSNYLAMIAGRANSDSLGYSLIVDQPLLVRLILGSIYLFVFPIPFWTGFQLNSVYHLYKSVNAVQFYFLIPLIFVLITNLFTKKYFLKPEIIFLFLIMIGSSMAISITSLETRHFGAFFMGIFILASVPDLRLEKDKWIFKISCIVTLGMVAVIHIAWIIIKYP